MPEDYRAMFAEILAMMDAEPKARKVKVFADSLTIDLEDGNPVFSMKGVAPVAADFRRRYLAEHLVPLTIDGSAVFEFLPTTGNRVKVRVR